jgi:GNAT superfamily N-acetyltransferase
MFYHRTRPLPPEFRGEDRAAQNRRDKEAFVQQGRSHGILVRAGERPVGWCQFGLRDELPRIDAGRIYRKIDLPDDVGKLWRITCFFVDRDYRHKGVARVALRATLDAIRERGGGVVEAYPATSRRAVGMWFGTVDMFERERFRTVCAFGNSNVLMRRTIRADVRSP